MTTTTRLLSRKRFLPLFCTQLLNAFNDNLYKTAMVLFVVYSVYNSEDREAMFSAVASALFIIPFVLLSAIAGQLADMRDKARIIRIVKLCEIGIMVLGAFGLFLAWRGIAVDAFAIPLLLFALLLAGIQSTFLGPIKYAILPQHLRKREVLAGTGLVEAGTYIAILAGTILAGVIPVEYVAGGIMVTAVVGYLASRQIPPALPMGEIEPIDWNVLRSSIRLIAGTMHDRQVWYAILAISFFWTIGAVLFIQFPPLAKNVLMASKEVASLFLVVFSIGVAIGSVGINTLLRNVVSARHAPVSVIAMGIFVIGFYLIARGWSGETTSGLLSIGEFVVQPMAPLLLISLLGIAISGGMFVVPLYAFLTTRVAPEYASRTIAANNIVNSLAMVGGALLVIALTALGMAVIEQVLLSAAMCLISAWLGRRLYRIECAADAVA
ncbi:MFS transporter [Qipengyuania sp. DY56-A-20]|jgi:MFS family permease|uniref:MFS transporter n=1 Tax=Qipengyuania benthica TaxID=3067651 RepID=A0ABT9H7U7_9SPHN|nr:MFS transporter [Qipengyuania sp. DY56-A-20]MDP4539109.1 MFS transporter [Qipengyuania sp. DY56-A-20]